MKRLIVLLLMLMTSFSSHSKESNKGSISLSIEPLSGRLEYKDNTLLSGLIGQKVNGIRLSDKIINTRKNNLVTGFGISYSELTGVKTLLGYGYLNSTYGNVYIYGYVKSIRILSLYSIIGYSINIDDEFIFYPNIQIGLQNLATTLEVNIDSVSAADRVLRGIYSINTIEYSLNTPIKIMFNNSIGMGFNFAINGPDIYISKNGEEVNGKIDNSLSIFIAYTP